jgi:arginyl-tRNA synthetase
VIRDRLAEAVSRAIDALAADVPALHGHGVEISFERPARKEHGDWSCSIALQLARVARASPLQVAEGIRRHLQPPPEVERVEIAGAGFINFFLKRSWLTDVVREVEEAGTAWGRISDPEPERIQVEFVSANPTGPLHVGHGRWAALGDALAAVLGAVGHDVEREFYVNDYGRQMDLFGASIAARYLQRFGREAHIPDGGYQGSYVTGIAEAIAAEHGDRFLGLPSSERNETLRDVGRDRMIAHQREVLERFGVRFDVWFHERSLHEQGAVGEGLERLAKAGLSYEKDGAVWARTTDFGDDKDRVVVRADGTTTYFAADLAYYLDKKARRLDRIIYLWGADHHGHAPRMRAAIEALGDDPERVEFIIGQLVNLTRAGEPVRMSKRTGELVTFEELLDEVGVDPARYTFLRQSADTSMDFDMELVVRQSQENPVYYVQYAHARIASIVRFASERGVALDPVAEVDLTLLEHSSELDLLRKIHELPEVVEVAARLRAPHRLTRYAEDLAALFHAFYRDCRVVTDDAALTQARLHLALATKITLANVLALLGVSAPEKMERSDEEP